MSIPFGNIDVTVNSVDYSFLPYDRGANGAFVYRMEGVSVHAPRVVVSTALNDLASDKQTVQLNVPRICPSDVSCGPDVILGTDLVKTELRFLATTSVGDRVLQIDQHIALLQELRELIEQRGTIYA